MDTVIDYFSRIAGDQWWRITAELLSIGLVVYWVVDFLEGTRGERLFQSVVFILITGAFILNLLAEQLGLLRLQYLYKGFLIFVIVIAAVAFQPEIRRALIRIGQPRFLTFSSRQLSKTVEEIITAVTDLAASSIGCIIVIEKRIALGEFIETGIRTDARITAELLKTIFRPGSALHDMAVVIRGDRIIAAKVQLPLAEPGTVDGLELGSRHRAAIGITAGSDATCLIVSEETAAISIAQAGKLTRNVTESDLRKHLTSMMDELMTPASAGLFDRVRKSANKKTNGKTEKSSA